MSVAEYGERWLSMCAGIRKESTLENYRWALGLVLPMLGGIDIAELSRAQIKAAVSHLVGRLSRGSVRLVIATLRAMLMSALDDELIERNPARAIFGRLAISDGNEKLKVLTAQELVRFLAIEAGPYHRLWDLLAHSGLRIGEAVQLTAGDLDVEGRRVRVRGETTKTGVARFVDLPCGVIRRLAPSPTTPASLLLRAPKGGRIWPRAARRSFKRVLEAAGLDESLSPHCLRHTYASLLVASGAPLDYVRRQLGHRSIKITVDLYGHHAPTDCRRWLSPLED